MDELIEGVLPIRARLSEADFARLEGQHRSVLSHALTVALHVHLRAHRETMTQNHRQGMVIWRFFSGTRGEETIRPPVRGDLSCRHSSASMMPRDKTE